MTSILNSNSVANEWCGSWASDTWANGYIKVIPMVGYAGISNVIMSDLDLSRVVCEANMHGSMRGKTSKNYC